MGQIQFPVSKPLNLFTGANPVIAFSCGVRISGNRTAPSAEEYSVEGGTSALPAQMECRQLATDRREVPESQSPFDTPSGEEVTVRVEGQPGHRRLVCFPMR